MIHYKRKLLFILICFAACVFFFLDIFMGSVFIAPSHIMHILFGFEKGSADSIIILQSRLPKAITAVLVGAALPIAGICMQTYFKNPIAGPDILGVSAGSSLFVAFVMLSTSSYFAQVQFASGAIILASILGAFCILCVLLLVSAKMKDTITLLVFGIMFGMALSSVVGILQYFSEKGALKLFVLWSFGSLQGVTWSQLYFLIPIILICLLFAFTLSKKLNLLLLGDQYAKSLGLNLVRTKYEVIIVTSILTGTITAFCGPIAFVGIAIPHLARMLFKTNNHFILIPASVLIGSMMMNICDIISTTPGSIGILPLNSITAMMGAPFIIYILLQNQKIKRYFS